jgi:CRP/FNR family transcriptional regulator, cyclic AMP receptor protein
MENLERILVEHPFFQGMKEEQLELLVGCASNVRFDAGELILREGEEANIFYLIRHGRVALEIFAPERGPVTIQTLGEGEVLGWSWLVSPYRWRLSARAVELTRAVALDGKCLRAKSESDYHLGYELFKRFSQVMMERLQAAHFQLLNVYGTR